MWSGHQKYLKKFTPAISVNGSRVHHAFLLFPAIGTELGFGIMITTIPSKPITIAAFDPKILRKTLQLGPNIDVFAFTPLGYATPEAIQPPKKRKSLEEITSFL